LARSAASAAVLSAMMRGSTSAANWPFCALSPFSTANS